MKLQPDDPRLTAYVLGELDATERREVEAALTRQPELRREVEDLRELSHLASAACALQVAEAPALSADRMATIEEAIRASTDEVTQKKPEAEPVEAYRIAKRTSAAPFHWMWPFRRSRKTENDRPPRTWLTFMVESAVALSIILVLAGLAVPSIQMAASRGKPEYNQFASAMVAGGDGGALAPQPTVDLNALSLYADSGYAPSTPPPPPLMVFSTAPAKADLMFGEDRQSLALDKPNAITAVATDQAPPSVEDVYAIASSGSIAGQVMIAPEPTTAPTETDLKKIINDQGIYVETAQKGVLLSGYVDTNYTYQFAANNRVIEVEASPTSTALRGSQGFTITDLSPLLRGTETSEVGAGASRIRMIIPGSETDRARMKEDMQRQADKLRAQLAQQLKEMPALSGKPSEKESTKFKEDVTAIGRTYGELQSVEHKLEAIRQFELHGLPAAPNREGYNPLVDNPWKRAKEEPLSTFSIDVDTASYANVRRFLQSGQLPQKDAVRIEELINYFDYDYAPPPAIEEKSVTKESLASGPVPVFNFRPFAVHTEVGPAPWAPRHRLVRIGLKGREIAREQRPDSNFVFLIDVSGSMNQPNKLPLVKDALRLLAAQLGPRDRIAMVVYAGSSGLVLDATPGDDSAAIFGAIDALEAGGSTNGGAGIELAYKVAAEHFIKGGANRVILCTDGDFNVGTTSQGSLQDLIEQKRKSGVFLSVLGFGTGNVQDGTMELLANKGNGNYAYIDSLAEARKVFLEEMTGTLVTIAKDVKIQVDFNPGRVAGYRLIGYANRLLAPEDFNDDTKDAGEIGAGHTVTALYEIVPAGQPLPVDVAAVDPSKYAPRQPAAEAQGSGEAEAPADIAGELLTVRLRYKEPEGETSTRFDVPVTDGGATLDKTSADFKFAASLAAFGMQLRESPYKEAVTWKLIERLATQGADTGGGTNREAEAQRRAAHLELLKRARELSGR